MPETTLTRLEPDQFDAVNAMILRSKAFWGYDADMMAKMETVLRLDPAAADQSAEEAEKTREINSLGRLIEAPDLLNNSLAGDSLNGQTNHKAKHCCTAIELFTEDLLRVGGVGSGGRHHRSADAETLTNVTRH